MDNRLLTRRAVLSALTALAAVPATVAAAAPLAGTRFRDIRVDVAPLRASGNDIFADWIAVQLPGDLRKTFAAYLAPGDRGAATLVARIDEVFLGAPDTSLGTPGADAIDGIQGVGIVLSPRGGELASYPLYCAVGAQTLVNLPEQTDIMRRRVETLAQSFAQWLPGKMGL
ncbi:MAG: hypothetical protein ACLPSW_00865 [Roseiarcus sp.]